MNQDYTQPFWVGFNNPRFRYSRGGYLPALEYPNRVSSYPERVTDPEWQSTQWDVIKQLNAKVNYLQNKLNFHLDKNKRDLDF